MKRDTPASGRANIELALTSHQQGRFTDAENLYQEILREHPNHFDALHLLGVVALQTGRAERAIELIGKAIELNPHSAGALGNLGSALQELRQFEAALASYDKAIALRADYPLAHYGRGFALVKLNRCEEALASYDNAIALKADYAEAYNDRGNVLRELLRDEEALASFDNAVALKPSYAEAHNNRGIALRRLDRREEALASYDQAIALRPDYVEAHNNRGNVLRDLARHEEALLSYDKAIVLRPHDAGLHGNRGLTLMDLNRHEAALASHDVAVALKPDDAQTHANRGSLLMQIDRHEEALASYDRAIALRADDAVAHVNRGLALRQLNRHQEALASCDTAIVLKADYVEAHNIRGTIAADLACHEEALVSYDTAITLRPNYAPAHYNKSFSLLRLGRFEAGWRQYEWRKNLDKPIVNRRYRQPLWLGEEDISGATVFIYWEQGLGDTIQFCRYVRLVEPRGARVILSVQEPLYRLLLPFSPTIRIIRQYEEPSSFDYHCPLLSLPLAFATTLKTIPSEGRYIRAEVSSQAEWDARLPPKTRPRIGLAWSGKATHKNDHNRSVELSRIASILDFDADWISLQQEVRASDADILARDGRISPFGDTLTDLADTAALIELLDLVITVDTSVAHLAGAMGKPVWILLPYNSDFRWLLARTDSPWYPSARLFRQQKLGNWDAVIDQIQARLRAMPGVRR